MSVSPQEARSRHPSPSNPRPPSVPGTQWVLLDVGQDVVPGSGSLSVLCSCDPHARPGGILIPTFRMRKWSLRILVTRPSSHRDLGYKRGTSLPLEKHFLFSLTALSIPQHFPSDSVRALPSEAWNPGTLAHPGHLPLPPSMAMLPPPSLQLSRPHHLQLTYPSSRFSNTAPSPPH